MVTPKSTRPSSNERAEIEVAWSASVNSLAMTLASV